MLADFKESEKIPAELATSLESLSLEIRAINAFRPEARIGAALEGVAELGQRMLDWLKERIATLSLLEFY